MAFTFYNPVRITFGSGKLNELGGICARYGKKALLVTTPNSEAVLRPLFDRVKALLAASGVEVIHFDEVVPNPVVQGIEKAIGLVKEHGAEMIVAVGGGSCGSMVAEALAMGCDAFVTADVKHDQYLTAKAEGIALMDAGHFATENVVCAPLALRLAQQFPAVEALLSESYREAYSGL